MTKTAMIRPAWTPATIALMVLGFMIFWPLGLAMLAYIIWGDQLEMFKSDINRATGNVAEKFRSHAPTRHGPAKRTGNVAFDDWREVELSRLEEERRKLDEAAAEFDDYLRELRRAKDEEEFEAFMAAHKRKSSPPPKRRKKVTDN